MQIQYYNPTIIMMYNNSLLMLQILPGYCFIFIHLHLHYISLMLLLKVIYNWDRIHLCRWGLKCLLMDPTVEALQNIWVSLRFSGFLTPLKTCCRCTGYSKLPPRCEREFKSKCIFVLMYCIFIFGSDVQ